MVKALKQAASAANTSQDEIDQETPEDRIQRLQ